MIENNAFIVLDNSFVTARVRLPDSLAKAGPARIRTWDQGIMSPLL
jgi:hypothetical protein